MSDARLVCQDQQLRWIESLEDLQLSFGRRHDDTSAFKAQFRAGAIPKVDLAGVVTWQDEPRLSVHAEARRVDLSLVSGSLPAPLRDELAPLRLRGYLDLTGDLVFDEKSGLVPVVGQVAAAVTREPEPQQIATGTVVVDDEELDHIDISRG